MLKNIREPVVAPVWNEYMNYALSLRRAIPTSPTEPVPKSASEAGSGTGLAEVDAENDVRLAIGWPATY